MEYVQPRNTTFSRSLGIALCYRDIKWIEQKQNYWGLLGNQIDNFEDFGKPNHIRRRHGKKRRYV